VAVKEEGEEGEEEEEEEEEEDCVGGDGCSALVEVDMGLGFSEVMVIA
jgi:hypothetical protein